MIPGVGQWRFSTVCGCSISVTSGDCSRGRIFADLGTDVVQVEPLSGSTARRRVPHPLGADGDPLADSSCVWDAYVAKKRGVAANLDTADGQDAAHHRGVGKLVELQRTNSLWTRGRWSLIPISGLPRVWSTSGTAPSLVTSVGVKVRRGWVNSGSLARTRSVRRSRVVSVVVVGCKRSLCDGPGWCGDPQLSAGDHSSRGKLAGCRCGAGCGSKVRVARRSRMVGPLEPDSGRVRVEPRTPTTRRARPRACSRR